MPRILEPHRLSDHAVELRRLARAMCRDRHDADDLVQETYARLLSRPRRVTEDGDLAYLATALRNTYITHFRARQRRPTEVELAPDRLAADNPLGQPEAIVEARAVFAVVRDLPRSLAAALMAVDVVGLDLAEAAAATGQTPAEIERHLRRARLAAARRLAPAGASR
ncbi:MAG TPA: sigma-70 family RNA polymerase sigma factor [Capillimicrobium sp.]|jgi:RNA polymerase sigma-70 factor (ECF subfamily)